MKSIHLFVLFSLVLLGAAQNVFAGVSGTIATNTTWTADSAIIVSGNITINANVTLTIQPGAIIKFDGNYSITVNGSLNANGTSSNKILFTSNQGTPAAGNWAGIVLNGNGTSASTVLNYCRVVYASTGLNVNGMTTGNSLNMPTLTNLTMDSLSGSGITFNSSTLGTFIVQNVDFGVSGGMATGIGIYSSTVSIQNAIIRNVSSGNYGIYMTGTPSVVQIQNSTIAQVLPAKIRVGNGIYLDNGSTATVTGTTITSFDNGVYAYNGNNVRAAVTLTNNIITQNNQGIQIYCSSSSYQYPNAIATGNDIRQNVSWNVYCPNQGSGYLTYEFNFLGNYWGTTDGTVMAGKIYDYSDNNSVATVNYLPFLNASKDSGGVSTSMGYRAGYVHTDTTWTKAGGPYTILGSIKIDNGKTLTIEAGTTVQFAGSYDIEVNGRLLANGASGNQIVFTSGRTTKAGGDWAGIVLNGNGASASTVLNYCRVVYASTGLNVNGMTTGNSLNMPTLTNLTMDSLSGTGIVFNSSTLGTFVVQNVDIGASGGVTSGVSINYSAVNIQNATIRNIANGNYGIYMTGTSSVVQIQNCTIAQVLPAKIRVSNGIDIENGATATITGTTISSFDNGVYANNYNNVRPAVTLTNNIITQNNQGIQIYCSSSSYQYPNVIATGNDIRQNVSWNVYSPYQGSGYLTYEFNFMGNYWGTTDGTLMAGKIYDYSDNNSVATVNYLPFLNASKDSGGVSTSMGYRAGYVHTDTTWTKAGGPYTILGSIKIDNGKTLTIEAGTTVQFAGSYDIEVNGRLLANGASGNQIVFTSGRTTKAGGDWAGIVLNGNGASASTVLNYCRVVYASTGLNVNGMTTGNSLNMPTLTNLTMDSLSGTGIVFNSSTLGTFVVQNVDIGASGGVTSGVSINYSAVNIQNATIRNIANGNYGIYMTGTSSVVQIQNCTIAQVLPAKIRVGYGIYLDNGATATVTGTTISSFDNGVYANDYNNVRPAVTLTNNIITQNNQGIQIYCNSSSYQYPNVIATGNDIKQNVSWNVYCPYQGSGYLTYEFNFMGNYWGTTDGTVMAGKIYDYSDNNSVATVNYLPFLNASKDSGGVSTSMGYRAGYVHTDTTWTKAGGPYTILGSIKIDNGKTLTIEAGTTVQFAGSYDIEVNGRLLANGASGNQILFTSGKTTKAAGDWAGIVLNGNGASASTVLNYCRVVYASTGLNVNGMTTGNSLNMPTLTNLTMDSLSGNGIAFNSSTLGTFVIQNVDIGASGGVTSGINIYSSAVNIQNATIRNISSGNFGVYMTGTSSVVQIQNSIITQIQPAKLRTGIGIYLENGSTATVTGTTITSFDNGVYAYNGNNVRAAITLTNNIITQNNQGIQIYCSSSSYQYPNAIATGNDIKQNVSWNVYSPTSGSGYPTYEFNFMGNYWGTTDGTLMAGKIYDYSDNNSVATVNYLPFLNASKDSGGVSTSMGYRAGYVHTDTTWTKAGGPYTILGSIKIDNGKTLTIEAGTTVQFSGSYDIEVNGRLLANGASGNQIVFTSGRTTKAAGDWAGIVLNGNGTSASTVLNYCRVVYASTGLNVNGMTTGNSLNMPTMTNLTMDSLSGTGIVFNSSTLGTFIVQNVDFGVSGGMAIGIGIYSSTVSIQNATIRNISSGNHGIYMTGTSSVVQIQNSTIAQVLPARLQVGNGIYLDNGAAATVTGTTISGFDNGVYAYNGNNVRAAVTLTNNIITQNNQGVRIYCSSSSYQYPNVIATGNDIRQNVSWNVYCPNQGSGYLTYEFNFLGNYWGTTDGTLMAGKIYDYSDNNSVATVNYLPFLNASKDSGGVSTSMGYRAGYVHTDTTWTKAGGPYTILGSIKIDNGKTLTIEAGTTVQFSGSYDIEVNGRLLANGASGNQILFTSGKTTKAAGDWIGIILNANNLDNITQLSYVKIEYAGIGININNVNSSNSVGTPSISNTITDNCSDKGIYVNNSVANISKVFIRNFANQGIYITGTSASINLTNNSLVTQDAANRVLTGSGINIDNGGTATVSGTTITNCNYGVYAYSNTASKPTISLSSCIIYKNNQGIYIGSASSSYNFPAISASTSDIKTNINWNIQIPTSGANPSTTILTFTNNYWNLADSASIAAKIYDYYDNSSVAKTLFMPFSATAKGGYGVADITKDGRTDGFDLSALAATFGLSSTDGGFNAAADLNTSNRVDGFDLALLGIHFGEYGVGLLPNFNKRSKNTSPQQQAAIFTEVHGTHFLQGDTISISVRVRDSQPLYAFASSFTFDKNQMKFIDLSDGGFISLLKTKIVLQLYDVTDGKGTIGISRSGKDTSFAEGAGQIALLRFIAQKETVFPSITQSDIGLIAPDGATGYDVVNLDKGTSQTEEVKLVPKTFQLFQNFPNPFNPSTMIRFQIPVAGQVKLVVFDILGRVVSTAFDKWISAGEYTIPFDGSNLSSGVYFYQIRANEFVSTKRMILVR